MLENSAVLEDRKTGQPGAEGNGGFMGETRLIVAGNCIDGTGGVVRRDVVLTIEDGMIIAIDAKTDRSPSKGLAIDDFSHCTLVPALVDCSISLLRSPALDPGIQAALHESGTGHRAALLDRHIRYCHAHGVLGVADDSDVSADLLKQSSSEETNLIILRTAGRNFLKVVYSPDIDAEPSPRPQLSRENLHRLLSRHESGKKVVVANGRQAVAEALAAGCDAIEQGYLMGEDNLRTMARNKVLWIPSVLRAKNALDGSGSGGDVCCRFSQRYVAPGKAIPGAETYWKRMLAGQLDQLRLARTLSVPTAVGTGAGSPGILHGESVVEEMKLFIRAGYSLEEAIRCASHVGSRFFAMEDLGTLTVGRPATFLITRGTPRQLPRKLSYLEGIYIKGEPSRAYRKNPVKMARMDA